MDEAGAKLARDRRRHRRAEEDPHVRTTSGLGNLQRCRNSPKAGRLYVRQRIQHGGTTVKVRRDPPASVLFSQGIQPNMLQPRKWSATTNGVSGKKPAPAILAPLRQPPATDGTQPERPSREFSHLTA